MRRFLIAVALCAIAAVSGAWTLQWDADSSWPTGTTVTACLNGACVAGVTGTSQPFAGNYSPGTVLHGTAQTVPPPGYQCGEPLAACPPSAIAEIAQTIPSDQSQPNRAAWAATGSSMAIAYTGSTSIQASSGSVSQSVTVPTGTNYAVIFYGGWSSTVRTVSALSLGGVSASNLYTRANADDAQDSYLYGVATSEGSKTLALTMSGAMTEGGIVQIAFLSGVDTTNPVVATNFAEAIAYAVAGATWTNMTSAVDGIGLVFATGYNTENTLTITAQSQTQIFNSSYNSDNYAAGYKLTTATTTTFGITVGGLQRYWSAVVVTLRAASGGDGSVTISGSAGTGGPGSVSVSGAALASLVGLAGSGTSGVVGAGGGATLAGLSGASGFGALSASGSATQSLIGLSGTGSSGILGAGGGASLTGPAMASSAGLLGAGGGGSLIGVSSSSGFGNISASGTATQSIVGLAGSGSAGTMGAGGGTLLSGSPGTSAAGLLSVSGAANQSITGIFAAGAAGLVSISSDAAVSLPAVFVTGYAGNVSASAGGSVNISVSGVAGTGALGSLSLSGTATKAISGVSGTGGYGLVTVSGGANKTISGASAGGSAGAVTLSANALLSLLGVQATPSAGIISVSGGASVSLSGISASGQVGSVIVSAGANAQIALSGAAATGYVGTLALSGNGLVLLDGNQAQGLVGTIRLTEVITPGGRLLAIASDDRTIIVQIENRVMTVMSDDPNLRIV